MHRLDGKVALVTGAARGIGAQIARRMAEAGASVVLCDILEERGHETASEVAAMGVARFIKLDVTVEGDWKSAVSKTVSGYGGLDILVNNAGVFLGRSIEEVSDHDWERIIAVNLNGVYLGTKLCAPALRERGHTSMHGSSIVNLASTAGIVGSYIDPIYSMTKGGVTTFTKAMALAFSGRGDQIRVNSIHPGVVDTAMGKQTFVCQAANCEQRSIEAIRQAAIGMYPLGRIGTPDDIALGATYLASDAAGFVTGASLVIDGGFTAQ
ncbi:MAG: SDR family NAD(P)-dependent oxidoreductase [Hyphomicrobiaceae bacterium]